MFRGWSTKSGGGNSEAWKPPNVKKLLNDTEGIRPHAFLKGGGHNTIFEVPELSKVANSHLYSVSYGRLSEFSSWGASLSVPFYFLENQHVVEESYLAILDTSRLPENVTVWHVPVLHVAGIAGAAFYHEYLIHGCVEGEAYSCIPMKTLQANGLSNNLIHPDPNWTSVQSNLDTPSDFTRLHTHTYMPISLVEARTAKKLGMCFAEAFATRFNGSPRDRDDLTLVIFTAFMARRAWSTYEIQEADRRTTMIVLAEEPAVTAPVEWKREDWIQTDKVYWTKYPDLRRMIWTLRDFVKRLPAPAFVTYPGTMTWVSASADSRAAEVSGRQPTKKAHKATQKAKPAAKPPNRTDRKRKSPGTLGDTKRRPAKRQKEGKEAPWMADDASGEEKPTPWSERLRPRRKV